ncbi:ankyrin repeat-containing domain protein [Aspergillus recurvatus]
MFATNIAAFNGPENAMFRIIREGQESMHQANSQGKTPLLWSSWTGEYEAPEVLLKEETDMNAMSQLYGTSLLVAALKCHANIVQLLPEQKIRMVNGSHDCALRAAAHGGHGPIVNTLLGHSAAGQYSDREYKGRTLTKLVSGTIFSP